MKRLKEKWGITSNLQLSVILIVFAVTGTSAARISKFFMEALNLTREDLGFAIYYVIFLVLVLPLYPFILMAFGWLFGQSQFFFPFGRKLLRQLSFNLLFTEKK
jgi:hypothetical protein